MNYLELRKKYSEFVYESFTYNLSDKNLEICFTFKYGEMEFHPQLRFKNIPVSRFESLKQETIENLIFHLGLAETPSYWKAFCSPNIIIKAGYLNDDQLSWWHDLFINGMGQYFFENKIDFTQKDFVSIECASDKEYQFGNDNSLNGVLIPVGGGKDSAVTLELLKNINSSAAFLVNPTKAAKDITKASNIVNIIEVERHIDTKLFKLNKEGYLNGHTPFSSLIAFLSVTSAYLFGYGEVALSNEQSSNEENTIYLGHKINHQYSKTFEFENKFRDYVKKYLTNVNYFSFLRPLYELQIAKVFSKMPKYSNLFRSCNVGQKTNSWCGNCSKCLSTYILLKPFLSEEELNAIFGGNLLKKESLKSTLADLIDPDKVKPFECVGTKEELKNAIDGNMSLLKTWNDDNNLSGEYEKLLRTKI